MCGAVLMFFMSNRPVGGGSAFGGGPTYRGGATTGSGTRSDPYRPAAPSRSTIGGSTGGGGRAPTGGEMPSERQLEAIRREGFDTADFIPQQPATITFARAGGSSGQITASSGFASRVEDLQSRGEFDRVVREEQASVGAQAVLARTTPFAAARLQEQSSRESSITVINTVEPAPARGGEFVRGAREGLFDPLGSLPMVTSRGGFVDEGISAPRQAGRIVGLPAGFIVSRGAGRVAGVASTRIGGAIARRAPGFSRVAAPTARAGLIAAGGASVGVEAFRISRLEPGMDRLSAVSSSAVLAGGFSVGFVRGSAPPVVRATGDVVVRGTRIPTTSGFREVTQFRQPATITRPTFTGTQTVPGEIVGRTVVRGQEVVTPVRSGFAVSAQTIAQPRFAGFQQPATVVSGRGFADTGSRTVTLDTRGDGLFFGGVSIDPAPGFAQIPGRQVFGVSGLGFPRQGDALRFSGLVSQQVTAPSRSAVVEGLFSPQRAVSPGLARSELGSFGFAPRSVVVSRPAPRVSDALLVRGRRAELSLSQQLVVERPRVAPRPPRPSRPDTSVLSVPGVTSSQAALSRVFATPARSGLFAVPSLRSSALSRSDAALSQSFLPAQRQQPVIRLDVAQRPAVVQRPFVSTAVFTLSDTRTVQRTTTAPPGFPVRPGTITPTTRPLPPAVPGLPSLPTGALGFSPGGAPRGAGRGFEYAPSLAGLRTTAANEPLLLTGLEVRPRTRRRRRSR